LSGLVTMGRDLKHGGAASASPPPCGEGMGVGVVVGADGRSSNNNYDPPPQPSPTPKSLLSDFGQAIKRPNSDKSEFGWGEGVAPAGLVEPVP
jgi:hypothetical protein